MYSLQHNVHIHHCCRFLKTDTSFILWYFIQHYRLHDLNTNYRGLKSVGKLIFNTGFTEGLGLFHSLCHQPRDQSI